MAQPQVPPGSAREHFRYDDILDRSSIRLLHFDAPTSEETAHDDSPLVRLTIKTYPLDAVPRYGALSYTWGPPGEGDAEYSEDDKRPILLNEKLLYVFPNLESALRMLSAKWLRRSRRGGEDEFGAETNEAAPSNDGGPGNSDADGEGVSKGENSSSTSASAGSAEGSTAARSDHKEEVHESSDKWFTRIDAGWQDIPEFLWVDAVCINQENLDERAAQVGMMDRVYQRSARTLIWIGANTDDSERLLPLFVAVSRLPLEGLYKPFQDGIHAVTLFVQQHSLPPLDSDIWDAAAAFLLHRWFGRAWVIQEAALSRRRMTVYWGEKAFPWLLLDGATRLLYAGNKSRYAFDLGRFPRWGEEPDGDLRVVNLAQRFGLLDNWCSACRPEFNADRFALLRLTSERVGFKRATATALLVFLALSQRDFDAGDRRDKIYSQLGLVRHLAELEGIDASGLPEPDYTSKSTPASVFLDVATRLFSEMNSLAVFGSAYGHEPADRVPGLPSWVPDFSARRGRPFASDNRWQAAAKSRAKAASASLTPCCRVEGRFLHVRGVVLDEISVLSATLDDIVQGRLQRWLPQLLALSPEYSYTGESRVEAFWRTLLMNWAHFHGLAAWPDVSDSNNFTSYMLYWLLQGDWLRPGQESGIPSSAPPVQNFVNELALSDSAGHMPYVTSFDDALAQLRASPLAGSPGETGKVFEAGVREMLWLQRVVISAGGYLANAPLPTNEGDVVAVLDTCPCAMVLRPCSGSRNYTLVGAAYVHGVDVGKFPRGEAEWQDLCLE